MLLTAVGGMAWAAAGNLVPARAGEAAVAAAPLVTATSQPSAADFSKLPFVEQAELSPDGTYFAGLFGIAGERRICSFNLFVQAKPLCVAIPDGTEPHSLRWVNDRNFIVSLQALESTASPEIEGPDRMYISRLIAINRDTGKITKLLWNLNGQDASDVLWVASDGTPIIEVAAQNSILLDQDFWPVVYRVDVETGSSSVMERGREGVSEWAADARGVVRVGYGYNDQARSFRLFYRGEGGGGLRVIERANTTKGENVAHPFLFVSGADHALTIHGDRAGHSAVYEVDLASGADVRQVYGASEGGEVVAVRTDNAGAELLAAYEGGTTGRAHWLDPTLAKVQADLDKAVTGRRASILSLSRDRNRMLVSVDRPDNPGALYFYDINAGSMHRLANFNEALDAQPLSPVSLVHYKARDGLPIEAVLTVPASRFIGGREAKNLPIVVMPHGGPWAHDELAYDYWAQFIASLGYAVLQPNFRGSDGYGLAFERKGEGQMGLAMQDDISDGLAWAAAQGIADPKRACIVGASYGGYAAMWGIEKDPDLYRCAISIAGVSALRREVNDFGTLLMGNKFKDDWNRMTPDFAAVSPINSIGRIKVPLLLIHGEKDATVAFTQSKAMYRRMLNAGKQVEFVDLPLADHYFGRQADREKLLGAIGVFLAKHNPVDPVPSAAAASSDTAEGAKH